MEERKITLTGTELMAMEFEDVPMLADKLLIRHGFCILASAPKVGKSWLCLDLHVKATSGGTFLGRFQLAGLRSLYLPLEDRERRMKRRLTAMNYVPSDTAIFHFGWVAEDQRPEDFIRDLVTKHHSNIVFIDDVRSATPGKIEEKDKAFGDYWRPVQALALELEILVIAVYHLRKMEHQDVFQMISGSSAFLGIADEAMVLRKDRGSSEATLDVVSRDFEDGAFDLEFDRKTLTWKLMGKSEERARGPAQQQVFDYIVEFGPQSAPEITKGLRKTKDDIKQFVRKLKEQGMIYFDKELKKYRVVTGDAHNPDTPDNHDGVQDSYDSYGGYDPSDV